jgi:hypothetical protein
MCEYVFIDKNFYPQNKKLINKFINQQDEAKINFKKNSNKIGCVEIYVEFLSDFEYFVEYMFRKLGKDVITYVGISIGYFQDLKEMNVMIPEIHEKMWEELDRYGQCTMICPKANDYKLIELLSDYDILYNDESEKDEELYIKSIEDKISEYRGINNEKSYHNDFFCPYVIYN